MLQNLQNFAIFQKLQLDNLVDFEKCCKTRILYYFLAKIGADTAENKQHFTEILPKTGNYPTGPPGRRRHSRSVIDQVRKRMQRSTTFASYSFVVTT